MTSELQPELSSKHREQLCHAKQNLLSAFLSFFLTWENWQYFKLNLNKRLGNLYLLLSFVKCFGSPRQGSNTVNPFY